MPVMSGLDCLRELNKRQSISSINVLVLTMHNEQQYIKEVMLLGAKGYLRKDTLDTELFKALRTLAEGRRYLAENDANSLLDSLMYIPPKKESLSSREEEVLNYIVRGYSLSDIAQKLCLSVKTISTYIISFVALIAALICINTRDAYSGAFISAVFYALAGFLGLFNFTNHKIIFVYGFMFIMFSIFSVLIGIKQKNASN